MGEQGLGDSAVPQDQTPCNPSRRSSRRQGLPGETSPFHRPNPRRGCRRSALHHGLQLLLEGCECFLPGAGDAHFMRLGLTLSAEGGSSMLLPDEAVGNGRVCPDNVTAGTRSRHEDANTVMCSGFSDNGYGLFQGLVHISGACHVHFHHPRQSPPSSSGRAAQKLG